jgi:hypothetical protein
MKMNHRKDYVAVITILLMCITTIPGILSLDFSHAYDFINQYGQKVSIFGYGIYAYDTYFKAPISIGTDICILFVLVPVYIYTYLKYRKGNDRISELKLISVYAISFYYAASIAFGVTYNQLFLVYILIFTCTLFGMFAHINHIQWDKAVRVTLGMKVFLILCGAALLVAWLPDIISALISRSTLSLIGVYTTEITYVLDMGILSPLCFCGLYLLIKRNPLGTMILAIMLKASIIVGVMMIPQTICQIASGVDIALPVLITKSLSFVLLGGYAFHLNHKLYKELENEEEK